MSKFLLLVFLAFFGAVACGTQIRLVNARYAQNGGFSVGLAANLLDSLNTTVGEGINSALDMDGGKPYTSIPSTGYDQLPVYSFLVGTPIRLSAFDLADTNPTLDPPLPRNELAGVNITLQEDQSYSAVYVATASDFVQELPSSNTPIDPAVLFVYEEIPQNPIPYGKALVRVVNVALSTYQSDDMVVTINGTESGASSQVVTLPFGEASDFLVYDSAFELTLYTTLRVDDGSLDRTWPFIAVVNSTVVIYLRGDIGDIVRKGTSQTTVAFPPPPPPTPVSPPTSTPMTSEPAAEPITETPAAPVASATPTARTPTKRVSSATQAVVQIAGVIALASMLL